MVVCLRVGRERKQGAKRFTEPQRHGDRSGGDPVQREESAPIELPTRLTENAWPPERAANASRFGRSLNKPRGARLAQPNTT